jgi:gliding motility-associated-like protein
MAVTSGSPSQSIPLAVGANIITTVITAQDGVTTKTVIITVNRALSNDANLSALKISTGTLSPVFSPTNITYSDNVATTVTSVTVTPTTDDPAATVKVNGTAVTSGTASAAIPLAVGSNAVKVAVTAPNGTTIQTYTVTVIRGTSTDALLTSVKLTPASTLTVVTGPSYVNYTTTVAATTSSVTVTATEQDPTATIKINGVTTASGVASASIPLAVGSNVINIVSTAQDGVTTKTYTITATRTASSDALLTSIKLTPVSTLTVVTGPGYVNYTTSVPNSTSSVTVTATTQDATATIKVNGVSVASGAASAAIPLVVGPNTITTVVTAQDGVTTKSYIITATRAASNNALLTSIKLTPASTLTIVTGPGYVNYTTSVPNTTSSVTVTATKQDAGASITVNGVTTASGTASAAIPLAVGSNTITTIVTAADGTTTKSYIITATRAAAGGTNNLDAISVTKPADNITIENDGVMVHQGVSPNGDGINDCLKIDGIASYPDNRLMIIDRNGVTVYQAKGYDNQTAAFDGHSNINGKMQLPGTYFYSLDYTVNGQSKHTTGYIILKY